METTPANVRLLLEAVSAAVQLYPWGLPPLPSACRFFTWDVSLQKWRKRKLPEKETRNIVCSIWIKPVRFDQAERKGHFRDRHAERLDRLHA